MERKTVYESLRRELLEQRRCQLQMYTLSAGVLPAALLFAEKANLGAFVFPACILFFIAALMMVFNKECSIFRKVGYLRILEENEQIQQWRWESDIDAFRQDPARFQDTTKGSHHSYVIMISVFINMLIWISVVLYAIQPFPAEHLQLPEWHKGVLALSCILVAVAGTLGTGISLYGFSYGSDSTSAIYDKWHHVLSKQYPNLRPKT